MTATRRLARNVAVDISTDNTNWLRLKGRVDNNRAITPNKVDSTDTDTDGFTSSEITLQSGVFTVKYNSLIDSGTPDPAHELVEDCIAEFGDNARLYVRVYDTDGGGRGYTARAIVECVPASTGVADLRAYTATFTLDGTITKMASGDVDTANSASVAPVVTSATPSAAAEGAQVTIVGQHFKDSAISSVKFGAVTATVNTIVSDTVIVAVMPAGSAGSAAVTVTNATGVSNSLAYTRGA